MGLSELESPTSPLSGVRSNQLSYRPLLNLKRVRRIELPTTAWKAVVLPLNYTRIIFTTPTGFEPAISSVTGRRGKRSEERRVGTGRRGRSQAEREREEKARSMVS